jgi:hypothetical protein
MSAARFLYGVPYMSAIVDETAGPDQVSVVVRGLSSSDLRRLAARRCERALGKQDCWCFTEADVRPCMVSLGGHVRLYEGRFVATRT